MGYKGTRWFDLLLWLLAIGGLAIFFILPWLTVLPLDDNLLDNNFPGAEAKTGGQLLDWANETNATIELPLWGVLIASALLGLVTLTRLGLALAAPSPRNVAWLNGLTGLGLLLAAANLALLGYITSEVDSEALEAGFWVAGGVDVILLGGLVLRVAKRQIPQSRPTTTTPLPPGALPGNARLLVHSGLMEGARQSITESPFTIGRQETNKLVLFDDLTVSRQHAVILYSSGVYFLRAVSPAQPLLVGKRPEELRPELSWRLESHDVFAIGEALIEFVVE